MHKYTPLETRIKNGDFEISDYRQQAFYELWLLDERLKTERSKYPSNESWLNRKEVIEKQQYDRYHKLMNAFDKEEPKLWDDLVRELADEFRHLGSSLSNAHISGGVSPSIEPLPANIYNLKTAKGVFIKKNPVLEALLEEKGFNIPSVWEQIARDKGSVYGLAEHILTDDEKEIFKTFKEINQLEIVRQAGIRQQYVDQTVSLNLCFDPDDSPRWMSEVHKEAHKAGVKTLYYLRTESVLRGDNLDRLSDCVSCEA